MSNNISENMNEQIDTSLVNHSANIIVKRSANGINFEIKIHGFNSSEVEDINSQVDDFYANHKGKIALFEAIY